MSRAVLPMLSVQFASKAALALRQNQRQVKFAVRNGSQPSMCRAYWWAGTASQTSRGRGQHSQARNNRNGLSCHITGGLFPEGKKNSLDDDLDQLRVALVFWEVGHVTP
eukprot:COSAG01_NODE_27_length_36706_cov_155.674106_3_plen_109_part_00